MKISNRIKSFSLVLMFGLLLVSTATFVIPNHHAQAATKTTAKPITEAPATATEPAVTSETEHTTEAEEKDAGVIGLFGLNWKLFLAQLVNFAIVLFVLWKWVFKPVVAGMDARTKKIEDSLNTADKVNKEREEFDQWKAKEMVSARHEATAIIAAAKTTATQTKDQILEQAKLEQQQILDQSKAELELQKQKTLEEAKASIADLVVQSTEKLLRAKLDGKTDAKLIKTVLGETDQELS